MKNEHGIELLVGQVWKYETPTGNHLTEPLVYIANEEVAWENEGKIKLLDGQFWNDDANNNVEVIAFYNGRIVVREGAKDHFYSNIPENFERLLFCPKMGDMRKHNVVTQEQRTKYKKPDCVEWFDEHYKLWKPVLQLTISDWDFDKHYRVPEDFDGWELREEEVVHVSNDHNIWCGQDGKYTELWDKVTCPKCVINGAEKQPINNVIQRRMKELGIEIPEPEDNEADPCSICDFDPANCGGCSRPGARNSNPQPATLEPLDQISYEWFRDAQTEEVADLFMCTITTLNKLIEDRK